MERVLAFAVLLVAAAQMPDTPQQEKPSEESFDINADDGNRALDIDLRGFHYSDIISFELSPKVQTEFFEIITELPKKISVLYLVSSRETNDIDLVIRDPRRKVVRQLMKRKEVSYQFTADQTGEYTFSFVNRKVLSPQYMEKLTVMFALHAGEPESREILPSDLSPVSQGLLEMAQDLQQFEIEQMISTSLQAAHFESNLSAAVQAANRSVFWLSLAECVGVVGLSVWQVYYIKQLLSHRRIL